MDRPDLQSQVDELRHDVQDLQGKMDKTLESVQEIHCALTSQKPFMGGPMGMQGMHAHGHHTMYGPRPMGGLFFLMTMLVIGSIVATTARHKMFASFRMHGLPGARFGMPFSRHCC